MKINFKELSEYSLYERAKGMYFKPIDFNCKYLIDGLHFPRNFTDPDKDILLKMEALYNFDKDTKVLLINDLGLQWVYELNKKYRITNFYILCVHTAYLKRDFIKICIEHQITNMYNMEDIKVIPVYLEEMKEMNKKFDVVIANPPYSCGNAIISEAMNYCEEAVVLMPIVKYKNNGLYKKVKNVTAISQKYDSFEDASTNPVIALLNNEINIENYLDFMVEHIVNTKFKLFYMFNINHSPTYIDHTYMISKDYLVDECTFLANMWAPNGGFARKVDSLEVLWNFTPHIDYKKDWIDFCSSKFPHKKQTGMTSIKFKTKKRKG